VDVSAIEPTRTHIRQAFSNRDETVPFIQLSSEGADGIHKMDPGRRVRTQTRHNNEIAMFKKLSIAAIVFKLIGAQTQGQLCTGQTTFNMGFCSLDDTNSCISRGYNAETATDGSCGGSVLLTSFVANYKEHLLRPTLWGFFWTVFQCPWVSQWGGVLFGG
jgi:hypothetical protein